jgi:hypothetical protein
LDWKINSCLALIPFEDAMTTPETDLEKATRNNFGSDPYKIKSDDLDHRTRFSDSSIYDLRCVTCGATDTPWDNQLNFRCSFPLPDKK